MPGAGYVLSLLVPTSGFTLSVSHQLVPLGVMPLRPEDVHALERAIAVGQEEMCRLFRALSAVSQLLQRERNQLIELWPRSMISGGTWEGSV